MKFLRIVAPSIVRQHTKYTLKYKWIKANKTPKAVIYTKCCNIETKKTKESSKVEQINQVTEHQDTE